MSKFSVSDHGYTRFARKRGWGELVVRGMYMCKLIDHTHCSPVQCFSLLNQTVCFFGPRLQTKGTYRFTLVRPSVEYIIDYYSIP